MKVPVLSAGDIWGVQVQSPAIPVVEGHRYQIAFYIKSDVPGAVRISFDNSLESEPLGNSFWPVNNDADFTSGNDKLFSTSPTWRQVIYDVNNLANDNEFIANTSSFQFRFDLGLVGEVTYYIDNITVVDLDSEDEFNYVENGNLESGDLAPMVALNPGDGITVTEEAKYSGTYGVKATASASSANEWDLQFQVPELILDSLKTYTMSFMVKSDGEGQGRISFPGLANEWPYQDWDGTGAKASFSTSSAWKQISFDFMPKYKPDVNAVKFNFDIGKVAGITYFIDDIKIVEKKEDLKSKSVLRAGPTIIEKTPEEKAQIIGDAMEKWISDMVGHYKGKVRAWDVVNEPINDNGTLRTGEGKELAADEFYWQDYLSWDYAVKAFNAAAAADPDAKLFINDFNLESTTPTKLDALIKYVEEIETKGARVDGIGTQMHLNINWSDTTGIKIMFEKLAATGKLIKVTELDVTFNTNANEDPASPIAPTLEQYDQQAELYRYVAEMYTRIIPENQQFGITVWGISDNEKEHQYWKKNDAPCLWDAKYVRKHAYKGFADGLAGKDVGAEFKQDEKWDGQ